MPSLNFNATNVAPMGISTPQLPVSGKEGFPAIITGSELKENKNKDGGYLALDLQIIEGEHKGECGVYRLNLFHSHPKTVEIAYAQLSAICHVTGVMNVVDSQQLHNIPFRVVTGLQKGDNPEHYTKVKGVLHMDGAAPGKSTGVPAQAAPQVPTPPPAQTAPAPQAPPVQAAAPAWGSQANPVVEAAPAATPPWAVPK